VNARMATRKNVTAKSDAFSHCGGKRREAGCLRAPSCRPRRRRANQRGNPRKAL
jgi:hypothetical protein